MRTLCATILLCSVALAETMKVTPAEDELAVLHNPDMGWVLYENYPLDQRPGGASNLVNLPDETFEGVDHVALMFAWSDVEREPGVYDWSKVDHAYDYWAERGKKIQLRMSTESLLWWNQLDPPAGVGVPQYVLDRLPEQSRQTRYCDGIPYVVVDAREPFYRERLEAFLAAAAEHFDDGRPVTLVDLRAFGLWGEWHTGFQYSSIEARREALIGIIDRFCDAFPRHKVALSYSYDPDAPPELRDGPIDRYDPAFTANYERFLHFSAFDHALTKPNITLRRDGCGGAVHSNERRLCQEAFAAGVGPMMSEFMDGYHSVRDKPQWLAWMIEDALSLHPNYVNLLGWQMENARDFLREQPDLIAHALRTTGYRLVPIEIEYAREAERDRDFVVASRWVNRGVGRALRDYRLELLAVGDDGTIAAAADAGTMQTSRWIKGAEYSHRAKVRFADLPAGEYRLQLRVIDPQDGRVIQLPLSEAGVEEAYQIGALRVKP
jgi:hypothetical protein